MRTVGTESDLEVDVMRHDLMPRDIYLSCSDGLYPIVTPEEMRSIVRDFDKKTACEKLVELANNRGGPDNITIQVIRVI